MTRVLLLKPYRPEALFVTAPPLGLMAVGAWLRERFRDEGRSLELRILDLNPARQLPGDVLSDILSFAPDVVGMSALSCEAEAVRASSALLKEHLPDVPVVLGGPFPSHDTDQALADPCIDYVVLNEGEETFEELVRTLADGGDPTAVAGIAFRRDAETVVNPSRPFLDDLDRLPLPAYDLIDVDAYSNAPRHSRVFAHRRYMSVVSTRGCPFRCIYCHVTMGKKTRFRSATKVVDEIEHLVKHYGIQEIHWSDDIWNLRRSRSKEICDQILQRGLKIKMAFPNGVRGDIFDDELLDKMRAAGTYHISFAPETGSPRMQKFIQKNAKLDVLQEVIAKAAARGIWCHGFFMVGFPTETEEDLRMTFDYALRSKLCTASFFVVNAHKGTRLYEIAKELGLTVEFKPSAHNYMNPEFQLAQIPTATLRKMMLRTYLRFFLSPRRLWRIWRALPRKSLLFDFGRELAFRLRDQVLGRSTDIYESEGVPDFESKPTLRPIARVNRI